MKKGCIVSVLLLASFNAVTGPHRIVWQGDTIVQEGTEASHTLTVKNTWNKAYEDLRITISGFSPSGLQCCGASSDELKIFENTLEDPGAVEAYCEHLEAGETVTLELITKGGLLEKPGDVNSIELSINVNPGNVRRGRILRKVSIFKAD